MRWAAALGLLGLVACGRTAPPSPSVEPTPVTPVAEPDAIRPLNLPLRGVAYGPFREGQRPGGPGPSEAELREDIALLEAHFEMIRVYSSRGPTEAILRLLKEQDSPLKVMLGAWISDEDPAANAAEVDAAIRLANAYPEQVVAVSVGNETQVDWSAHRSKPETLLEALKRTRAAVGQPVTTADDYNFWNKPEAAVVADEVDFLCLHAYAMWNGKTLEDAVSWTAATTADIAARHPKLPVVLCEAGWATELNPEGSETQHIKAPASAEEQRAFYQAYKAWTQQASIPHFYFEAFDEPWKGDDHPKAVEKHWGLFNVDRTPKLALQEMGDE